MNERRVVAGIMLSMFLASMEATVVATAMPTIASQLGGFAAYSWVFAAYLLTATTLVPVFGKLSDQYGRRPIYAAAMGFFLLGSLLCGMAQSMAQLVWARALQGVGAAGLLPVSFIMIGEMFTLKKRAEMQGLFSGVWGLSSVVGPLIGGFIVGALAWHWVFWINLPLGLLAFVIVWSSWSDAPRPAGAQHVSIDWLGAILLTAGVALLMLALPEGGSGANLWLLAASALLLAALFWWERQARNPVLPLPLFRERLFAVAVVHGVLSGWAIFGAINFVPLFVQGVQGASAAGAGAALTPMMLGWVLATTVGSRLLLRIDFKKLALAGVGLIAAGTLGMALADVETSRAWVMTSLALAGMGMGSSISAFLIAVQSTVERQSLGTATSMLTFSRSIGGTVGVGVMGALLSARVVSGAQAGGVTVTFADLSALLSNEGGGAIDEVLRVALAGGMSAVFTVSFVAALVALAVTTLAPAGLVATLAARRDREADLLGVPVEAPATPVGVILGE